MLFWKESLTTAFIASVEGSVLFSHSSPIIVFASVFTASMIAKYILKEEYNPHGKTPWNPLKIPEKKMTPSHKLPSHIS